MMRDGSPAVPPGRSPQVPPGRMRVVSLSTGLAIMVAGTLYPPVMTHASGQADHALALVLLWAMSAGFVRGVGFLPRHPVWRLVFSGWTCAALLVLALALKLLRP